jgi:CHAD domain-containing protein
MAEGKWISDLSADTPLDEAARHVLLVRLQVVCDYLPRAAHEADNDVEYVHQLRVATRRADAALRIFEPCLPERMWKKSRRRLKKVRRAAGAARDWDVFLAGVLDRPKEPTATQRPGLDFLVGYAQGQREAAQAELQAVEREQGPEFEKFLARTVEAIRPPHGESAPQTMLDLARTLLADLLQELEKAAGGDLEDYSQLHQVRIAGKRLRYALEVFAGCFGPAFRDTVYPQVEELQEMLGRANDSHVAVERLATLRDRLRQSQPGVWPRLRPGIESLLRFHQRRLPQERNRFARWWQSWQTEGREAVLASLPSASQGSSA